MAQRPIILAGATASGKSSLALKIAAREECCIINADALQVYSCWRVLSARPDDTDLGLATHELYGHVAGETRYSVGQWLRDIKSVLENAARQGVRPVVVGGTGLYLSALTDGLSEIPDISDDTRERSRCMIARGETDIMLRDLQNSDPEIYSQIDRCNPMRIQRAWEVLHSTGYGLSHWQKNKNKPLLPVRDCDCYVVTQNVTDLNDRIFRRFRQMIDTGALDECRAFLRSGLSHDLPAAKALGASQLFDYLAARSTLEEATEKASIATRQFAKRQRSWFRSRMSDWINVGPGDIDTIV